MAKAILSGVEKALKRSCLSGRLQELAPMGCDMVAALGKATADGIVLFAQNSPGPARQCQPLCRVGGRAHELGERVRTQFLELPQARQTFTVLGSQPEGYWGFQHGVNEHRLAIGCAG